MGSGASNRDVGSGGGEETATKEGLPLAGGHDEDALESRLLVRLGQVVGLLAGAATVVYLTGGIVILERLYLLDFDIGSALAIVPQLPREAVISEGLNSVVIWALAVGALYLALRLVTKFEHEPPRRPRHADSASSRRWALRRAIGFALGVVLVDAAVVGGRFLDGDGPSIERVAATLAVGVAVAIAVVYVAYDLRTRLAERYDTVPAWNSFGALALMAALVAAPFAPTAALISGTTPLPSAKVCALAGYSEIGLLIAETTDEVFIGESKFGLEGERRVVAFPLSRIEQLYVGFGAFDATCEAPRENPGQR